MTWDNWDNSSFGDHPGDFLSALVDGELTDHQRRAADDHLAVCAACRAELEATARIHLLVAGLPALAVPAPVSAGMMARGRSRRLAWAGAAAAVIGLSVLAAWPPNQRVTPPMTRFVQVHTVSSGRDPVSQLAPAAVRMSLRG